MEERQNKANIICIIILFLGLILFCVADFINNRFDGMIFEQLLYTIKTSQGANYSIVFSGFIYILIRLLFYLLVVIIIYKTFNGQK